MTPVIGKRVSTPNGEGVVEEIHGQFGWVYVRIGGELWAFPMNGVARVLPTDTKECAE
jgi:hypothetical protein